MQNDPHTPLVIVGGGLAGTVTLVHELLKIADDPTISSDRPIHITLLERFPQQLHGGIAYGDVPEFGEHRLNLSSKKVPIFKVDEMPEGFPSFPEYIQQLARDALDDPSKGQAVHDKYLACLQDPPRVLFGQYLEKIVGMATQKAGSKVRLTTRIGEAMALDVSGDHPVLTVREGDAERALHASHVVLSTGFKETLRAPFLNKVLDHERYLDDGYSPEANAFYATLLAEEGAKSPDAQAANHTMIIGTGLSGADAAIRLLRSGYKGKITMLSRNGIEHAGYENTDSAEDYLQNGLHGEARPERIAQLEQKPPRFMQVVDTAAQSGEGDHGSLERRLMESMKSEFSVLVQRKGFTPEEVLSYWERFIPQVSDVLETSACRRLYDQYAIWLTTHRIGTTPENTRLMNEAQRSGQLEVVAGYISTKEDEMPKGKDGKIHVVYTPAARVQRAEQCGNIAPRDYYSTSDANSTAEPKSLVVDQLISGMGYHLDFHNAEGKIRDDMPPLWDSLAKAGAIDWHRKSGEGLNVDKDFTLLNQKGERVEGVTAVGVPVSGAIMFSDLPYIEKPGKSGGRFPPFQANVVGTASAAVAMVDALHERIRQRDPLPPRVMPAGAKVGIVRAAQPERARG